MNYLKALQLTQSGFWIKSKITGRVFKPEMVGAKMIGIHAASTNDYGVTEQEVKGAWTWDKYRTEG